MLGTWEKIYERDCINGDNDGERYDEYDDGDVPFVLTRLNILSATYIP